MKNLFKFLLLTLISCSFYACKKNSVDDWKTIKKLYRTYQNGTISECKLNGDNIFVAGLNAYDAGAIMYNNNGEKIGDCNYAWDSVDSICGQVKDCETVYRCKDHISGQPEIDKYNIKKGLFR